jgi:hypothetical protein
LDNLSDVTVPTPSTNDYLKWNGTAWVNAALPSGSTSQQGIVQLSDSTTSTSTSLAGTANSVRQGDRDTYVRLLMEVS